MQKQQSQSEIRPSSEGLTGNAANNGKKKIEPMEQYGVQAHGLPLRTEE